LKEDNSWTTKRRGGDPTDRTMKKEINEYALD
jgi:hypothetical protein